MNQLKDKIVLLEKADRIEELEKGRQRSENTEVLAAEEEESNIQKKMAEQEKSKEGHDEKSLLSMKNTKKDVMKVVEEKERITNLLKEAKNFPGDKEAQVNVLEQNISISSKEDFVSDVDAAEPLVKIVSESRDTPMISKILSKCNHSEASFSG